MHLWRRCRGGCVPQRGSWRVLMTSISRPDQREWAMSWQPAFRSCGLTPGSECMVAKPTSGTGQGRNPRCVTFCRDKLKRRILTQGCGEDPKSPTTEQGIKVLGTPLGHEDFVNQHLERQKHRKLLRRIPTLPDVQSAWLLLLHCASTRANYMLRVVRPEWALEFARAHDQEVWECLCHILTVPTGPESVARASTTFPLAMGGLGLRSAERTRWPAYWASWADTLPMIRERHPEVADLIVYHLKGGASSPCLGSACRAATTLDGVDGFEVPSWSAVAAGQRPPIMEVEDREPGVPRQGWQHAAAIRIESSFRTEILMPRMSPVEQALLRSQSGPCAGVAFSVCPSSPLTRIGSALFRVPLQRRLHLPLPLSQRICGCGRPLDPFGHHRAACSMTGSLGRRGFPLESAAARVCREAGGVES